MISYLFVLAVFISSSGDDILVETSGKYLSAEGIQWRIESVVYSEIFDEADTTILEYLYSPPDTFSLVGDMEKIIGLGDTLWVMSARHRQVHKKTIAGIVMPAEYILNWKENYDLDGFSKNDSRTSFYLLGKESVNPSELTLTIDKKKRIKTIAYKDTKGDLVTLTIKREKLKRPQKYDLFFLSIPDGYDFIDLTE
ncbi:MAG: hypothetical protein V3W18_05645 [candidate division Zixibacteria bacterium]